MLHDPAMTHDPHEPPPLRGGDAPPRQAVEPPPVQNPCASTSPIDIDDSWTNRSLWALTGERIQNASSFLVSALVHAGILVLFAVLVAGSDDDVGRVTLEITPVTEGLESPTELDIVDPSEMLKATDAAPTESPLIQMARTANAPNIPSPFAAPEADCVESLPTPRPIYWDSHKLLQSSHVVVGGGFEGRTQEQRARLAAAGGGTEASENAVELGLAWLAAHQRQDGGWRLNHDQGPCAGRCGNPGTLGTSTGATALGLLPFLGAGYTHQQGPYQEVVAQGLDYLVSRMRKTNHGGDLQEGTMYAQGLATVALCEAYAMSDDPHLRIPAQEAIDFICAAQHPMGGWRYNPGQPGDTTVTGWQLMALKSGRLAGLRVPSPVTELVKKYLNSVQDGGGAFYGYQRPEKESTCTSVGLLCRMYLGWKKNDERLGRGVNYLSNLGPSNTDMYFNYYATQVLHHYGGYPWQRWNEHLRDYLISRQAKSGHERGSWFFPDPHGAAGGRIYTTSVCIMMLEVYYRHMPLYGTDAVEHSF